jgi:hypothetical protein
MLVQLDWFFTTSNWTTIYPNTVVLSLSKIMLDHAPSVVSVYTVIPKLISYVLKNIRLTNKVFSIVFRQLGILNVGIIMKLLRFQGK